MKKKVLYLPVESKLREADAKILLALEAVRRGFVVVFGSKTMLRNISSHPEGILLYKDASSPMEAKFREAKASGHYVVVHDEEGFIQMNWDDYLATRVQFATLAYVDQFLCWGAAQAKAIESAKSLYNPQLKVTSTGHPRIDLLRPPVANYHEATDLKRGKRILINTKLAEYNHRLGEGAWIEILDAHAMIKDEQSRDFRIQQVAYKRDLLERYVELLRRLADAFPTVEVMVRPHPSENIDYWHKKARDLPNVRVDRTGPVGYWIARSDVIIHTGCTTAVEALINGKPAISYKPIIDHRFEVPLPDSISYTANDAAGCIAHINDILNGNTQKPFDNELTLERLRGDITSLCGEFAYNRIMDVLEAVDIPRHGVRLIRYRLSPLYFLFRRLRSYMRRSRIPEMDLHEDYLIDTCAKIRDAIGVSHQVKVSKVSDGLFLLQ